MRNLLDQLTGQSLLRTVLLGVLGLLLVLIPGTLINIIVFIVGAVIIVAGVLCLYKHVRADGWSFGNLQAWFGPLLIVGGILLMIFARPLLAILPIFLGLVLVAGGAYYLYTALRSENRNWVQIIIGALAVIVGLVIVFNPLDTLDTLLRIVGAVLLAACAYELFSYFRGQKK